MADFEETKEPLKGGEESVQTERDTVKPAGETEALAEEKTKIHEEENSEKDGLEYLDEDLDDDFVEKEAEAFLNEVGEPEEESENQPVEPEEPEEDSSESEKDSREPEEESCGPEEDRLPETAAAGAAVGYAAAERGSGRGRSRKKAPASRRETERQFSESESEKRPSGKGKKRALFAAGAVAAVILAAGAGYLVMGQKYKKVFFPNTQINGIDASGRTVEEVQALIASGIDGYVLTVEERNGEKEQIKKDDINLHSEFDGSLEKLLAAQEPVKWLKYKMNPTSYQIETMIAYDEEAFQSKVNALACMTDALMVKPENARLSDYVPGQGYTVVPEIMGNTVKKDVAEKGIADAIMNLKETVSLEELGSYESPSVKSDDAALVNLCDTMNRYAGVTVTYQFGSKTEVLNGERTHEWLAVNADYSVDVDAAKAAAFVEELAISHDTYNKAKTIRTSYGPTIRVTGGTYGWRINRSAETEALIEVIKAGESVEREPVYSQKAASHGENDYGSTYVEINLTAQHLFYYKDGNKIVESDFVSGNLSKGWGTPAGTYPLTYKQRNATLKGEGYRTPVDYWMPFNGGIGLHDATWRSSFGGSIYKTGGSHGCVNLPHSVAQKIYENISSGTPVICYNLGGTESGGSSEKPAETTAPAETPAETLPVETPPVETPPAETQPPAGPAGGTLPAPTQAPETQPAPETTAPAGPGSDTGVGSGVGPGSV